MKNFKKCASQRRFPLWVVKVSPLITLRVEP